VDRYATPAATARQYELARLGGAAGVYTPQVVVGGKDWRIWPRLPEAATQAAPVTATLQRDGDRVSVRVAPSRTGAARLSGYWAVLEDGHVSRVAAGENAGETLKHDHVVRLYQPVPAWSAADGQQAALDITRGLPANPRRVVFVVTDALTQRPLQAVSLGC